MNEGHLRKILTSYISYYHRWRTHQSLEVDGPERRDVHTIDRGSVVEIDHLGSLHHHYERVAA